MKLTKKETKRRLKAKKMWNKILNDLNDLTNLKLGN